MSQSKERAAIKVLIDVDAWDAKLEEIEEETFGRIFGAAAEKIYPRAAPLNAGGKELHV